MKVFLAGATGALGRQLVPMLTSSGHKVMCMTRSPDRFEGLRALGAEGVVADAFDRDGVMRLVTAAQPDVVVHQMTALAKMRSLRNFDEEFALTNRLRAEGGRHLLDAAQAAGARVFIAQSYTGWPNDPRGSRIKTEDDPLDSNPVKGMEQTLEAIRHLEAMTTSAEHITGIALRYGSFYGPGTSINPGGDIAEVVRKRSFPIVGNGAGIWSFIHIADAAKATQLAAERGIAGIYNIVDDEPAPVSVWLPYLAEVLGAKPPPRVPAWLGRLIIGEPGLFMMTGTTGSSNAKAKRDLGWDPTYRSWRSGFGAFSSVAGQ